MNRMLGKSANRENDTESFSKKNHDDVSKSELNHNDDVFAVNGYDQNGSIARDHLETDITVNSVHGIFNISKNFDCTKLKSDNESLKTSIISTDVNVNLEAKDTEMRAALSKVARNLGLYSTTPVDENVYYGVYMPAETLLSDDDDGVHVYTNKADALKVMKQFKMARFKQFKRKADAVAFAVHGAEVHPTSSTCANGGSEKTIPFKGPKTQDMVKFRKAIECGDLAVVKKLVWENPRYLVSSGDTPSILQEGSRYNALHVAAKARNPEMCHLLLDIISSVQFVSHLYDDHDPSSCQSRREVLLDLYLNMPDKGLNETPLHFASKHGAVEVVRLLVSYPQCQRNRLNKYQMTAKDMVCSRVLDCAASRDTILSLLEEQYFVPVLRYEDNTLQPRVGDPFSPTLSPLSIAVDPLSPRLEVQAYAGPMSKEEADRMKRRWRTSPRSLTQTNIKMSDTEKGLECIGRNLAAELQVPWKEYWSFLDTFVDLSSEEGLQLLEDYLKKRFHETYLEASCSEERQISSPLSPMTDLCEAFGSCSLQEGSFTSARPLLVTSRSQRPAAEKPDRTDRNDRQPYMRREDGLAGCHPHPATPSVGFNPSLYLDRSCQVFAKRIATAIYAVLASSTDLYEVCTNSLRDALTSEVRHLRSLVLSYLQDPRFEGLEVHSIHWRVVAAAVMDLQGLMSKEEEEMLARSLARTEGSDDAQTDEEETAYDRGVSRTAADNAVLRQHVKCLMGMLPGLLVATGVVGAVGAVGGVGAPAQCGCPWTACSRQGAKPRSATKRSQLRKADDPPDPPGARRILFHSEVSDEESDDGGHFVTPAGSPAQRDVAAEASDASDASDSEPMEDPCSFPDTFINGETADRTDLAVLDAIEPAMSTLSFGRYPNIYRWRHLVHLALSQQRDTRPASPGAWHRAGLWLTPGSRPRSRDRRSLDPADILESPEASEPWERVTGPFSPRRKRRPSLTELAASPLTSR